jgi:hypothetical protein
VIGPVVSPREAGQRPMVCIREERLSEAIPDPAACGRIPTGSAEASPKVYLSRPILVSRSERCGAG